jgi:hypothetical protein
MSYIWGESGNGKDFAESAQKNLLADGLKVIVLNCYLRYE